MSQFSIESLKVKQGDVLSLGNQNTDETFGLKKEEIKDATKKLYKRLAELHDRLYAEKKQSVLLVLQAMDAAGKDSTIGKLTKNISAHGVRAQSFGKPTKEELAHDFLWRIHKVAPKAGEMVIFNRSHYEDVLIVKVHGWVNEEKINLRYQQINQFESLLTDNQTKVVKIMLNISPEYQLGRFKNRLEVAGKNWKFNPGDLVERAKWNEYMQAFSSALQNCSTPDAPWYVIPAENRWFRDYAVARILVETLEAMTPVYPEPDYDAEKYTVDSIL